MSRKRVEVCVRELSLRTAACRNGKDAFLLTTLTSESNGAAIRRPGGNDPVSWFVRKLFDLLRTYRFDIEIKRVGRVAIAAIPGKGNLASVGRKSRRYFPTGQGCERSDAEVLLSRGVGTRCRPISQAHKEKSPDRNQQ